MHRIPGKVAGSVAALAAVALLSACGGNDSTASQTPTLSSSAAASTTSAEVITPPSEADPTPSESPDSSVPEQPQTAPEGQPTPAGPVTGNDQAFLDELSKNGINPADPSVALTAANYICQTRATGASDADIATFVAAMAGTDPAFDESKMDVNKAAEIYIAAATATYC
ncbi:hypothetical protein BOX37_00755 [Nocardia mangyaensis]|uniref:DUF732 domain-containing protein n=1 Tax=Nocardia mangyaensis TaxID=2213200 RepID=A0A1J0VL64_9NOCA|nr:DUF732 domain-containing protein [Nocardia mangyaensis]APE32743.1 hypothetical protein BOX37_00755 [Nocardia mangyaensis]